MEVDLVFVRERDQVIELRERLLVVLAGTRLEPGPEHVEARERVAELVHLREVGFDVRRVPLDRPTHRGLCGYPVRTDGDEPLSTSREVRAIELGRR